MIKKLILSLTIASAFVFFACNSKSTTEQEYDKASSVMVSAFSLQSNNKVLDSLQNVFFSIDLVNAKIFNADSLPYGTKVDRLVTNITTVTTASEVKLAYPRPGMNDSIVDYLTNSTDSIDFSNGPVKLTVVSQSGLVTRDYEIKVNVHQTKPDTLAWYQMQSAQLPSSFDVPDAQRTAEFNGRFYCLTSKGSAYCLATTDDPLNPSWTTQDVTLPFAADVESLAATTESLYMLDQSGALYQSSDFASWTDTGHAWHYVYGAYGDQIMGCKQADGKWFIATYPDGSLYEMPVDFPIEGTSQLATYTTPMGVDAQAVMLGGRTADGKLLNGAWSYDGQYWAYVTRKGLPFRLQDMMMVAYDIFEVPSSTWSPVQWPVLLATGGRVADGAVNTTVYLSKDWGLTWAKAPDLLQLPAQLPKVYGATWYVRSSTMHASRSCDGWTSIALRSLPPQCSWMAPQLSRIAKPVDEWECPAIYMFGGRNPDGETQNQLWRGLILRYTYQPVY